MLNKTAYQKFLQDIGIAFDQVSEVSWDQMRKINSLLKTFPATVGEVPRSPFDLIRLNYGFYRNCPRLSIKKIAELYCVSPHLIHSQINNIREKLTSYNLRLAIMEILNVPYEPIEIIPYEERLLRPIEELPFDFTDAPDVKIINILKKNGVYTIGQLIKHTTIDLLRMQGFGRKSLGFLKESLRELNMFLKDYSH